MRHQNVAALDVGTYFGEIIGNKHLATRALLVAVRPKVLMLFQTYDLALPQLQAPALVTWTEDTKAALLSCYNVGTIQLQRLKDEIIAALKEQGEINLQRCSYCMLNDPSTWDHYLPKDNYPEYSVYHPNLLYICFGCNHLKSNYFDANALLYCHPYFTVSETEPLLHCSVTVDEDRLVIKYYGAGVGALQLKGEIVQRHLERLGLITRFQGEAASLVSSLIGEIRNYFPGGIQSKPLKGILCRRYAEARDKLGNNAWDARLWHGGSGLIRLLRQAERSPTP